MRTTAALVLLALAATTYAAGITATVKGDKTCVKFESRNRSVCLTPAEWTQAAEVVKNAAPATK